MPDNSTDTLNQLEQDLGIQFSDKKLLQQVFIHRSYLNEHRSLGIGHNERLEFLGDAVLELVVTEYLFRNFPNPKGELTSWRSALVKGETLAEVAIELNFPNYLLLSHGETKSGGRQKNLLLANAFEAFIGALYLDAGYKACQKFLDSRVISRLENILKNNLFIDPKSQLQEYTQRHFNMTPSYRIVSETGPDHAKVFVAEVLVGDKVLGTGNGSSKQAAQVGAAEAALSSVLSSSEG